jgi:hypothetical protein
VSAVIILDSRSLGVRSGKSGKTRYSDPILGGKILAAKFQGIPQHPVASVATLPDYQ